MLISPLGENAVFVSFGNAISEELNQKAVSLCRALENDPFPGMIEAVPAYCSATVFYDLVAARKAFPDSPTVFEAVSKRVEAVGKSSRTDTDQDRRLHTIPMIIDTDSSPDLENAAKLRGIEPDEFIRIFIERTYRVFMIGFLPGFAYMGEVDERLAVPRLREPRTKVAKGSIGIAGKQTGIYPQDSPGGWQLIGRTDVELFDPKQAEPCLFHAGDEVRFVQV